MSDAAPPRIAPRRIAPRRIAVVGCSGSGKSTLAERIAARLALPYVATDAVFWTAHWMPTPKFEVHAWLAAATTEPAWVTDGNFDDRRDLLWDRADLIVWLDLPLALNLWRGARRNLGWWASRAKVWGGQRMTLGKAATGVRHIWRSHGLKRATFPGFLAGYPPQKVVRLSSRTAVDAWLAELSGGASR